MQGLAFFFGFLNMVRHVVGHIRTSDQLVTKACTDTRQQHTNIKANINSPSGIQTRNPSNQVTKTYALERAVTVTGLYIYSKEEAVQLQATRALEGRGGVAPTHS
jgi:hypothetical protein